MTVRYIYIAVHDCRYMYNRTKKYGSQPFNIMYGTLYMVKINEPQLPWLRTAIYHTGLDVKMEVTHQMSIWCTCTFCTYRRHIQLCVYTVHVYVHVHVYPLTDLLLGTAHVFFITNPSRLFTILTSLVSDGITSCSVMTFTPQNLAIVCICIYTHT